MWLRTAAIGGFSSTGSLVRLSGLTFDVTAEKRLELEVLNATREAETALADKRLMFDALVSANDPEAPPPTLWIPATPRSKRPSTTCARSSPRSACATPR